MQSGRRACIDFTDLVVDDTIALEGIEAFTIIVGSSMAMVTIIDDDGEYKYGCHTFWVYFCTIEVLHALHVLGIFIRPNRDRGLIFL